MAGPSDLTQVLLPSFVLSLSYQCLSVDMGAKQHLQIQGASSQERCRVSRKFFEYRGDPRLLPCRWDLP